MLFSEISGREAVKAKTMLDCIFAIPWVDGSPSVPACGQTTLSVGFFDLHIQTLIFPTNANEAPSSQGKTLRL